MKKTFIIAALASFTIVSCGKDRTCTCTDSNDKDSKTSTTTVTLVDVSKSQAKAQCVSTRYVSNNVTYKSDCKLN